MWLFTMKLVTNQYFIFKIIIMTQMTNCHVSDYLGYELYYIIFSDYWIMGKLSLYRSRRNVSKKGKGHPKKYAMPLKTKDIDIALSYESSSDCDEYKDGETSNSFQCDVQEISKKSEKSI